MATYPSNIPAFVTPGATLSSPAHSTQHNTVNAEVVAICATLGTNPQGTEATVKDRLETIEASIGTTGHSQNTDLGTTNATFYINGITGPYLKGVTGNLQLRNSSDSAYVNLTLLDVNVQGSITNGVNSVTVVQLASAVANDHTHANKATLDTYNQTNVNLTSAVALKHTQNTDTGSDNETFQLNNGNVLSAKIKVDDLQPTVVEIRNGADSGYADIRAADFRGYLQADNTDLNRPTIKFDEVTDRWQLSNNGVSFVDIGTGLSQGGAVGNVQYHGASNLAGEAVFTYDDSTNTLSVPNISLSTNLTNGVQTVTVLQLSNTVSASHAAATAGTGIAVGGGSGQEISNTAPDQTVVLSNGTGISATGTYPSFTITNTAPDQTVTLSNGTGISATGTYPAFTITNTAPDQTVSLSNGTGISTSGTYPSFTITNTAPDQTVSIASGTGISATGTYPSFTVALSHLGIQSLTDPGADRLMMWDDTDGSVQWVTVGTGLTYTHSTHTLSSTSYLTRGTFVNGDLSTGVLTITHNKALAAPYTVMVTIFDNNNKQIIPDEVTGSTNSVAIDLTSYGTLTGTWGYGYIA